MQIKTPVPDTTLLSNGSATSEYVRVPRGAYVLYAEGTWGGTTLTLQQKSPNGTPIAVPEVSLTANGRVYAVLGEADTRVVLTGGTPSAMYVALVYVGEANGQNAATISGVATETTLDAVKTAVQIMDDWDESDRAKVNLIVGQAGVTGGSGVVGAAVQRVVLATDVALPAGTNAIGKLAANSGVDIGDVDVTSVPADPFGANADAASATGSISAKLRYIAGTGIPITGTVTVGSHAVTNTGIFAVQVDGAALTALQLIDDVIFADDVAFTPATSKVAAIGCLADETATDSVDEGDIGIPRMTLDRKQHVVMELESNSARASGTGVTPKFAAISASSSGNNTLVASVSSKKIRVTSLSLIANGAVNVKFQSGAGGTDLTGLYYLAANSGFVLPFNPHGWFETAATTLLNANLSGAVAVGGCLTYLEI